jgi:UDP-N-acetylglucosamine 2-epimerase (non-hydrolysing)
MSNLKIALVIGTRPNYMKAIPIWTSLKKYMPIENIFFIHTGQHYSHDLSQIFLDEFKIDEKEIYFLEKHSDTPYPKNSSTDSFYWISNNLSNFFVNKKIDKVIVFGDVNSTFASALAAYMNNIYIIHIESGLRSYDMEMPEERNRIMVDKMSNMLFTTELLAIENLKKEGIFNNVHHCGNTMIDTLNKYLTDVKEFSYYKTFNLNKFNYIILTIHRQENVENELILKKIIETIKDIVIQLKHKVLFITHPRTLKKIQELNINLESDIIVLNSQSYLQMLNLVYNCGIILTDSGGLQEESAYLGIPCITIRNNTERPLTVTKGYNTVITPSDENFKSNIFEKIIYNYGKRKNNTEIVKEMGNGYSSDKITKLILSI